MIKHNKNEKKEGNKKKKCGELLEIWVVTFFRLREAWSIKTK